MSMTYLDVPSVKLKPGMNGTLPLGRSLEDGAAIHLDPETVTILLVIDAKSAGDMTVYGGDSVFADGDKTVNVPTEGVYFYYLEPGKYLKTTGEHRGKILLEGSADLKATVVELI